MVERYGVYKADLEHFAQALRRAGVAAFQPCATCRETPGWVYVTDEAGERRAARCECFKSWAQMRLDMATA